MNKIKKFFGKIRTAFRYINNYGFLRGTVKILHNIFEAWEWRLNRRAERKNNKKEQEFIKKMHEKIESLINDEKYKYVFVFYPYTEWNLPIFQRPQQIALALTESREDVLYFFCTANFMYDHIDRLKELNNNLYVTTEYEYIMNLKTDKRILHLYSTDVMSGIDEVNKAIETDKILYEYIDEIHEDITHSLTSDYLKKHDYIMSHEDCYIVTTADKLYEDAKKVRKDKFILSTNGVKVEDFILANDKKEYIPKEIVELKSKYKKIIGYYGALAKWFDFELLKKCASTYTEYAFLLIGVEYDKSLNESKILEMYPNVIYIGKINYSDLVYYSKNIDLLTIPFLINDITKSTSPVKLFEYMALQKPILTTDLPECKKYKSVNIGINHDDYIAKIEKVIELDNDEDYKKIQLEEAYNNSWSNKANDIIKLLDNKGV